MKVIDVIFALIAGRVVGFVVSDFLQELNITTTLYENIIIWLIFPLLALFFLWLAYLVGKKLVVVFQVAKFFLVGAFATVIDLKLFEFLLWGFAFFISIHSVILKAVSFLLATAIKYWGNKYWSFGKHENEDMQKEVIQFFLITLVGLMIDVTVFYCATKFVSPVINVPPALWTKISIILAALAAAVWNFLGYKFFVFKK